MNVQMCVIDSEKRFGLIQLFVELGYETSGQVFGFHPIVAVNGEKKFLTVRPFFIKDVKYVTADEEFFSSIELLKATATMQAIEAFILSAHSITFKDSMWQQP